MRLINRNGKIMLSQLEALAEGSTLHSGIGLKGRKKKITADPTNERNVMIFNLCENGESIKLSAMHFIMDETEGWRYIDYRRNNKMQLRIIIEYDDVTDSYSAVCPELPGCASFGDTEEEALVNAREAAELYLTQDEAYQMHPSAHVYQVAL